MADDAGEATVDEDLRAKTPPMEEEQEDKEQPAKCTAQVGSSSARPPLPSRPPPGRSGGALLRQQSLDRFVSAGAVAPKDQRLKVDLKVTGNGDLQAAVAAIEREIEARREADVELIEFHLKHIEEQLDLDVANKFEHRRLSLEHLELYQQYIHRIAAPLSPRTENVVKELDKRVSVMLQRHPLADTPRSGDREHNESGSAGLLKVPMGRRRQTAVMLWLNLLTGPTLIFTFLFLVWYFVPFSNWLYLALFIWIAYDRGRTSQWWRGHAIFHLFRDYFPIRHLKANTKAAFPAKGNYLFGYHPHGVQSAGAFAMATKASGFDELFPGLSCSVQTLGMNFKLPIMRDQVIALGMGDASKACLTRALTQSPGSSAVLVTGGAKESMQAHPFTSKVVLQTRCGFVKLALKTGASLVPMWGFGENNVYENLAIGSPTVLRWQRRIQRAITFAPLLVQGRGVFSYSGGFIPHRRPITVVIGDPIACGPAQAEPSDESIRRAHERYKAAVQELHDKYKGIYDPKAEPLQFI